MNARLLHVVVFACAGLAPMRADDSAPAPPVPTSASNVYPEVTCTTNDTVACADTLQLAADTREALTRLLKLGPDWRFPVNIRVVTPDDPLAATVTGEAARVQLRDDTVSIEAVVPLDDPMAREFIQRQYVIALLWERFFGGTKKFDQTTRLDVTPLWLVEGLREWINEDPTHNREGIARRALETQTAPTLAEITGWRQLSDDRLMGLWQRAFSYYLVASLVREGPRRDDFQQWLDSFSSPGGSGQLHFPTEANWQQELADASARSHNLVYSWEETADAFDDDEVITFAASKTAPVQTCTIEEAVAKPRTPELLRAVQERIDILTGLELRANSNWHEILEAYRTALITLMDDPQPAHAKRLMAEAHGLHEAEVAQHQKLVDYLNWFEVTRDFGPTTSRFRAYFATAKRMEQVEADPTHPNPIRANLLQIESQL